MVEANYTLGFLNFIYTFIVFTSACCIYAAMSMSYLVLSFFRDMWVNFLEKRFPELEFVKKTTLRSVVDTHRNVGIITLLVTLKGSCDPAMIRKRLMEDILEKRQNDGRYIYRHLRMTLTTRWGWYAWQKLVPFNIDNHLVFASTHYRGRPMSDANVQEYVSETVSKYLIPDLPPWQITVFQHSTVEKYYLLIRFHHMLLSQEGLHLGDLLLLSKNKNEIVTSKSETDENVYFSKDYNNLRRSHPFQDLYKVPKALPILYQQICEIFNNNLNEFLFSYDPVENPSILKNPSVTTTIAIFFVVLVALAKQVINLRKINLKTISNAFKQRGLTLSLIFWSIWNTFNPLSFILNLALTFFNVTVFLLIKLPLFLACEIRSLCMINDEKYLDASYIKAILALWIILKDSLKEAIYYWKLFYNGPRILLEELLMVDKNSRHQLQFVSLCGRKVVSWSEAIPKEKIHEIQDVTGASASEILISATSASLRDLLIQYSLDIPDNILTTARYFPQEDLIQNRNRQISSNCGSGVLCLPLPIRNPFELEYDPITELRAVQQIILRARLRQPALYLASLSQLKYGILTQVLPSPILRLVLNLLSRKFPITLNEVAPAEMEEEFKKRYLWGQEVEDLIYWRPPQANICISLTLMTFGEYVKLGVMADALLSPYHTVITSTFAQHIWDLATASGVANNFRNYVVSDDSDTPGVSHSSHNTTLSSSSADLDLDSKNYSDDENNVNVEETFRKYPVCKKLQFNIPC